MTTELLSIDNKAGTDMEARKCPSMLGHTFHRWVYLHPTLEQLTEMRRLYDGGLRGSIGCPLEDVADRVCTRCHATESNVDKFINAMHHARGANLD